MIPNGRSRETVAMEPDPTNSHWVGRGTPIDDADAIVRVGYTADATPYWIDVPASAWIQPQGSALAIARAAPAPPAAVRPTVIHTRQKAASAANDPYRPVHQQQCRNARRPLKWIPAPGACRDRPSMPRDMASHKR